MNSSNLWHEVISGHHGNLQGNAGLLGDFLQRGSTRQRVNATSVAHHTDTCGGRQRTTLEVTTMVAQSVCASTCVFSLCVCVSDRDTLTRVHEQGIERDHINKLPVKVYFDGSV